MSNLPVLVLWDVDHTLIDAGGMGRTVYARALPAVTGRPLRALPIFAGRTELAIMQDCLRRNGVEPTAELLHRLAQTIIDEHQNTRAELADCGRVLPGVAATLAAFAADQTVRQSLLTGNLREVARIKVEVFGLDGYLDLVAGAYGEDHVDRAQLVRHAQDRATRRFGVPFDDTRTVLVGDTPNDVRAALAAGVHVIGVATGQNAVEELRQAGARVVLPELAPELARKSITELLDEPPRDP